MEDTTENCPRITTKAHTIRHSHERRAEDVPVIEGDDTLPGLISGSYGSSTLYLYEETGTAVAVIARTEQAALEYLADFGVLDGWLLDEKEAREMEEQGRGVIRLGNAGEPFDSDFLDTYSVLSTFTVNDIEHYHQRLTFNRDGWMHLYSNNPHNDRPPYRDIFTCIDIEDDGKIHILATHEPNNGNGPIGADFVRGLVIAELLNMVDNNR